MKTKFVLAILVAIVTMAAVFAPEGASAQVFGKKKVILSPLDQKVSDGCHELASPIKVNKKDTVKVALAEFYELNGLPSDYTRYLYEKQLYFLVKEGKFKIIDKGLASKVADEQKVWLNGLSEGEVAMKMGEYLDVSYLLVGTIVEFPNFINVNARMVSTKNGEVIAATSYDLDKKWVVTSSVYQYRNEPPEITPYKKVPVQSEVQNQLNPENPQNQLAPQGQAINQTVPETDTYEGFEFSNPVKRVEGTAVIIEVTFTSVNGDELDFGNVSIPGVKTELRCGASKYPVQGIKALGVKSLTYSDPRMKFNPGSPVTMQFRFPNAAKDFSKIEGAVILVKGKKSFIKGDALSFNF